MPSTIELLSGLTVLRFNQNDLVELPEEVCKLTSLTELAVSDNYIEELPLTLALMTQLKTLVTFGNESHKPPREIMPLGLLRIQEYLALLLSAGGKLPNNYIIGGKTLENSIGILDLSNWALVHLDRRYVACKNFVECW